MIQTTLDWLVNTAALVTLASYAWSMRRHFRAVNVSAQANLLFIASAGTGFALLAQIWSDEQPIAALCAGLILQIASFALFWWAIRASRSAQLRYVFDEDAPATLVVDGPYRFIRHPFYSAYILFWSGWSLASWSWWSIIPALGLAAAYAAAARAEEARFARTAMSADYAAYVGRTGAFFPKLR